MLVRGITAMVEEDRRAKCRTMKENNNMIEDRLQMYWRHDEQGKIER